MGTTPRAITPAEVIFGAVSIVYMHGVASKPTNEWVQGARYYGSDNGAMPTIGSINLKEVLRG